MQVSADNIRLQFKERASHLDSVYTPYSLDTPLEWLSEWMAVNREKLNEEDMIVLCSIGAMIHREKLLKEAAARKRRS